ncbi:hypothetical protein E2C06_29240 [Dankookia rubra]|uniref:Uncharacterized protein n=1 Tax=Dankookia rubra TaxID=1442381 RepID=A0A4R5QA28_9PROT|nr:hypothetical protein [Dankookia rubra]TDH59067.1 hypothetical protein E2C06_29240 [Dankookia rubra]
MRAAQPSTEAEPETTDQSALRLMLSYVEAECLRMGATDAARHAALAASLMPDTPPPREVEAEPRAIRRPRGTRLH